MAVIVMGTIGEAVDALVYAFFFPLCFFRLLFFKKQ